MHAGVTTVDPTAPAISSIRDATKWLLASAAAILAALTAGLPFSAIGSFDGLALVIALACAIAATGAALWIVLAAARVLADSGIPFDELVVKASGPRLDNVAGDSRGRSSVPPDPDARRAAIEADPLLAGLRSLDSILFAGQASPIVLRDRLTDARAATGPDAALRLERASADVQLYTAMASQRKLTSMFDRLRVQVLIAAPLILAAVVVFLIVSATVSAADRAHRTAQAGAAATAALPVRAPTAVTIAPTPAGRAAFGPRCIAPALRGVAIGGTWDAPLVVVASPQTCVGRLRLTTSLGLAAPAEP